MSTSQPPIEKPLVRDDEEFDLDGATDKIAEAYGVPSAVWKKITGVESGDNPNAVSPKKAAGRWQLMPETAKNLGVKMGDPLSEAEGALRYLRDNYKAVRPYAKNEKHAWMAASAGYISSRQPRRVCCGCGLPHGAGLDTDR